ncbi:MAG: Cell envelope-related transcriptional attenuator [Candidatus Levybacteria bacterium]|nr:Cell envelope-related transcriptional attenuator [Candidatus Levybacteria bacterium]
MDNNISFSKIVATPTLNSWSQAYNAGKLFAVLSLEKTQELTSEIESLNMLGKDLLERLEQEFFAIEDKNLESIKQAISSIFAREVGGVTISFAAGAFINNILYLFGLGNAAVFIKRGGSLGVALDCKDMTVKDLVSSSGFLQEKDLIVLATEAFSQVVTQDELDSNLNDLQPAEIAESLAPKIHKAENGKISAIVIRYANPVAGPPDTQGELGESLRAGEVIDEGIEVQEELKQERIQKQASPLNQSGTASALIKYWSLFKSKFRKPNFKIIPVKKIYLSVAVILALILISGVFLTIREQNNTKVKALFAQIYPEAQKKYDEGQGLADLNKNFARDAFTSAQKILNDNKVKFPTKSTELTQVQDLLKKVEEGLAQVSPIDKSGLDRSTLSVTVQNGSGVEGVAGKAAAILKDFGYNIISTGNADNYNYVGVTIKVKKEKSNFADLLKKDLSKDYTISKTSSDLSPNSSPSAVIIIGK